MGRYRGLLVDILACVFKARSVLNMADGHVDHEGLEWVRVSTYASDLPLECAVRIARDTPMDGAVYCGHKTYANDNEGERDSLRVIRHEYPSLGIGMTD